MIFSSNTKTESINSQIRTIITQQCSLNPPAHSSISIIGFETGKYL